MPKTDTERKVVSCLTATTGISRVPDIYKYRTHFVKFISLGDEYFTQKNYLIKRQFL